MNKIKNFMKLSGISNYFGISTHRACLTNLSNVIMYKQFDKHEVDYIIIEG